MPDGQKVRLPIPPPPKKMYYCSWFSKPIFIDNFEGYISTFKVEGLKCLKFGEK